MIKLLIISLCLILASCGLYIDQQNIREGMLSLEQRQTAFLYEWGKPDRLYTISGEDHISANWDRSGGGFFKGKETFEVWVYEKRKVELIFDDDKELAGWNTQATVKELATPDKQPALYLSPK